MLPLWVRRRINKKLSPPVRHLGFIRARQHQGMIDTWESLIGFDAREYTDIDVWQKNWGCLLNDGESFSSGDIMYLTDKAGRSEILSKFYN